MTACKLSDKQADAWNIAIVQAVTKAPILTDAVSMIQPYANDDVSIACIDEKWRLAIGDGFWELSVQEQAFVICHEVSHCLNMHFQRARSAHQTDRKSSLLAQDIEIDQQFTGIIGLSMPDCYPMPRDYNLPRYKTMEEYYPPLFEQSGVGSDASQSGNGGNESNGNIGQSDSGQGNNQNDSHSGKTAVSGSRKHGKDGKPAGCSNDNPELIGKQADSAGIDAASAFMITSAMERTMKRAVQAKQAGFGAASDKIADWLIDGMKPPKADWRDILRHIVSMARTSKSFQSIDRSFNKVNKRAASFMPDIIIPGYISFNPQAVFALDTSGSMRKKEIMAALNEAQEIVKNGLGEDCLKAFCVDTEMKDVQPVSDVNDLDITGGGGTDMMPAFRYICELPKRDKPDVFVLATDGFVPWDTCKRWLPDWQCEIIILITDNDGLKQIPDWMHDNATVIDISDNK